MDYDIGSAFEAIENELIESMMRNFSRHRAEEDELGYNWSQWQAEQLKSLEQYRKANSTKFNEQFSTINAKVAQMLRIAREDGNAEQEIAILEAIQNGFKVPDVVPDVSTGEFFKVNNRKLDALIKATTSDLEKAETAILRRANDEYRSAIFNAQVYANTGAGTYEKAVDMAVRDMLRAGLSCVEYKNGSMHRLSEYAKMAIRTANKRAYLYGEGEKRQEWGISTVVVNSRQGGCHLCKDYIGKVFIDDVYSGGKKSDGNYPLLSKAIEHGLFHPNCKDSTSTYFEGITTLEPLSSDEREELDRRRKLETQKNYYDNQAEKCDRISEHSLDKDNKRTYKKRAQACKQKAEEIGGKIAESLAKSNDSGIIETRNIKSREMANGMRKPSSHILSEVEITSLKEDIVAIGADKAVFRFNRGRYTGYNDELDIINIKGDVLPDVSSKHPRDIMSTRAVLAHEYYGHRAHRGTGLSKGSWNDEFRASYTAAKNTPNLSDEDRIYLILDALERAKEAGVSIKYNSFIRRILYGE